jgi:hypothetical protein
MSGCYVFDTLNSSFDTSLVLSDNCAAPNTLECNIDYHPSPGYQARLFYTVAAGEDYLITIDGYSPSTTGAWQLDILPCDEAETTCNDGVDEDFDARIDCDDADCIGDAACPFVSSSLYISEFEDGPTDRKFVELHNGGTTSVQLNNYQLRRYVNGNDIPVDVSLPTALIAPGGTWVIANSGAGQAAFEAQYGVLANVTYSGIAAGNGDDVYELALNGVRTDIYGTIGTASTPWNYEDKRVVRTGSIVSGQAIWDATEWMLDTNVGTPGIH